MYSSVLLVKLVLVKAIMNTNKDIDCTGREGYKAGFADKCSIPGGGTVASPFCHRRRPAYPGRLFCAECTTSCDCSAGSFCMQRIETDEMGS